MDFMPYSGLLEPLGELFAALPLKTPALTVLEH
jgi:hypothetical protein